MFSECLLTAVSCLCLLPILHATVFRLDELISLCTLIYTPIAGIFAAVTFATAIMYTLLAPCCWNLETFHSSPSPHSFLVIPS